MAIKRRFNELQDLVVQPVQNEFTGPVSPYFTISELPNPVPQGKSSFLIDGADELFGGYPRYQNISNFWEISLARAHTPYTSVA